MTEITTAMRSGQVCVVDVFGATIARIEAVNPTINAFTKLTVDRARAEAAKVDMLVAAGNALCAATTLAGKHEP